MGNKSRINIDLKDKKLLFALDFNARASYKELGKKVGLSKQGVEYKLKSLQKSGIIKGFYPVINVPKLGYSYCRLTLTLQKVTKEKRDEITAYVRDHPKVSWLLEVQGPYDLFIVFWLKSMTEFRQTIDEFYSKYGDYIKARIESIGTDVVHFQARYVIGSKSSDEIHVKETPERETIDTIDRKILEKLCENARVSLIDITKAIKSSAKVVAYRIRRLEQKRIILGYRPIINHNLLGFTYYKILFSLSAAAAKEVAMLRAYVKQQPSVIYIVEQVGWQADLDIELMVASTQELFDFINGLRFRFPALVGEYQTALFVDTLKVRYLPF